MWYGGNPCFAKQRGSCSKIDQDKHGGHFQRLQLKEILLTYIVQVTGEQMTSTFLTNVVGPLMLTKVRLLY